MHTAEPKLVGVYSMLFKKVVLGIFGYVHVISNTERTIFNSIFSLLLSLFVETWGIRGGCYYSQGSQRHLRLNQTFKAWREGESEKQGETGRKRRQGDREDKKFWNFPADISSAC